MKPCPATFNFPRPGFAGERVLQGSGMDTRKAAMLRFAVMAACLMSEGLYAGEVHYYYTDPNGNVLAKADAQGNIIARYDYKP